MASLFARGDGKKLAWHIACRSSTGARRTIYLGRIGAHAARRMKPRVETLKAAVISGTPPDHDTGMWLRELSDKMHQKLAKVGLVAPRQPEETAPTLEVWVSKYIHQRTTDLKPASIKKLNRTKVLLGRHFGNNIPIDGISPDGAKDWRAALASSGLSEATVRQHCRNAKTIFNDAAERELIAKNPFRKLRSTSIAGSKDRYVTPAETDDILEACPNGRWRTLFGLARLAGLRVPSESHGLTWADVDWDRGRILVRSPKTERHDGKESRFVPIAPKLAPILREAIEAAEDGEERVVVLANPRRLASIVTRAGVPAWNKLYQTLRQSCETEWAMSFPAHAVAAWLGHSEVVSQRHYLMVPDELFDQAAGRSAVPKSSALFSAAERSTPSHRLATGYGDATKTSSATNASLTEHPISTASRRWARRESNPHPAFARGDFKSPASAIPPLALFVVAAETYRKT